MSEEAICSARMTPQDFRETVVEPVSHQLRLHHKMTHRVSLGSASDGSPRAPLSGGFLGDVTIAVVPNPFSSGCGPDIVLLNWHNGPDDFVGAATADDLDGLELCVWDLHTRAELAAEDRARVTPSQASGTPDSSASLASQGENQ